MAHDHANDPRDHAHDDPRLAVRRHHDRCFHRVEEVVPGEHGGYVVQGILFPREEVAEVMELDASGAPLPNCRKPGVRIL